MKSVFKSISYLVIASLISCVSGEESGNETINSTVGDTLTQVTSDTLVEDVPKSTKKIKLAILLDTSGSMEGLIEQTKNQLWKIINQLAKAKDENGGDPEIELALYQYGNDGLPVTNGYVQQISGFTSELDDLSEELFALRTNGGSEYCGSVIKSSLNELNWSENSEDLQFIFIAGNEGFNQGPDAYQSICKEAFERNVVVNTIYCGDYQQGINTLWKDGADLGRGRYMNIDSDAKTVHYSSPYDTKIAELNMKLNDTYIPYGRIGNAKKQKQLAQDENAMELSEANAVKRYVSKGSKVYKNYTWDLVDASDKRGFDINTIKESDLPKEMKNMTITQKNDYITDFKNQRGEIKKSIFALNKQREEHIIMVKASDPNLANNQLDNAIINAIIEQAEAKRFYFEN